MKTLPNCALLKNACISFPGGMPTALAPEVSESKARPVPSPIMVTLSQ